MAGKRLLDAAKLIDAGRAVIKQHVAIRQQQWDLYQKTSGLAKGVKAQTDRVTLTAGAAYELAKRFSESTPTWQDEQRSPEYEADHSSQSRSRTQSSAPTDARVEDATRADTTTPVSYSAQKSVDKDADDGTLSSLRRRELQRQAERQIPSVAADTQPGQEQGIGQDTFSDRSTHTTPELSSLPRTRLPKNNADTPPSIPSDLNQDVFPSPTAVNQTSASEQPPEDVNTDIFVNPRVSRMLGSSDSSFKSPYAGRQKLPSQPLPEMTAAAARWAEERKVAAQAQEMTPVSTETTSKKAGEHDMDTKDLADSTAAEASQQTESVLNDEPASKPYELRESRVPSSRFGRIWQYSGLATSMAFGAVGESFRRVVGGGGTGSLMLSEANLNRLVSKLSRMRGAALKLGQMISFQDSKVLPPTINAVLQRVQDSADYMPASQRNKVLVHSLGQDWRDLFSNFEERPFAAASIGQVHKATLASNGEAVAVKIQYPGVKNSIDSDLNNLSLLLTASQLLPKGLFLDKTIANARTELGWECDYRREAEAQTRFTSLLHDEATTFAVPTVYPEACGDDVLTAEFMHGTAVTKIPDLTQPERDHIGTQILRLCLRELMEWQFMQTDPNWTNFLYNRDTKRIELLDFGASRDFAPSFVEPYVTLLIAASRGDRATAAEKSRELGYLTGGESPAMLAAHVDSVLTLAEPFVESAPEVYDFAGQTITDRVRANIGLMLRERLAPPPEETYSLHRKLSGAFLLCARLRSKVPAREMFRNAVKVWEGREKKVSI